MVSKNKFALIGGFDEVLRGAENLDLRIRLSRLGEVCFVNKCLYYYRKHSTNLTTDSSAMNDAWSMLISKHFSSEVHHDKALYRYVTSKYYYNIGADRFSKMQLIDAAPYFLKAILNNPKNLDSYVRLLRCCLGVKINSTLSKMKSNT
jgi:hypothetical protein